MTLEASIVECGRRIEAFATLLPGLMGQEVSTDLMRHHRDAPKSVMEALFTHLLIWSRAEGYRWFVMGMAPMSGFESSPIAPLWARAGRLLYEHGTPLYNFQGLRDFKEKFDPTWRPKYMASPGGLTLPRVLADVATLISRGTSGLVGR